MHWGKRNSQNFPGSELTLIPGEKHHCGPPVRVGPYGGQVINFISAVTHSEDRYGCGFPRPYHGYFSSSWSRKWQPTPVFLPGESQGREPGGLPSMGLH